MKYLVVLVGLAFLSKSAKSQIELTLKALPYLNSSGISLTSDILFKNTGARNRYLADAFIDAGSISMSKNRRKIFTISGGISFAEGESNIRMFVKNKTGLNEGLAGFSDPSGYGMLYLQFEFLKLTKAGVAKFEERNSRRFYTNVYQGFILNTVTCTHWYGMAYHNTTRYLQRFTINPVVPINLEVGLSRYYMVRSNAKRFNIGADYKLFAVFQLPTLLRLDATKFNSNFSRTSTSYHLTKPMIRVGIQASIPSVTFTLRSAEKMK